MKHKEKNVYLLAVEVVINSVQHFKTWKPIKLLFEKRRYKNNGRWEFRGTLVEYIKFCRRNHFVICITGREFL